MSTLTVAQANTISGIVHFFGHSSLSLTRGLARFLTALLLTVTNHQSLSNSRWLELFLRQWIPSPDLTVSPFNFHIRDSYSAVFLRALIRSPALTVSPFNFHRGCMAPFTVAFTLPRRAANQLPGILIKRN